jgi:hypothetical protein
VHSSPQLQGTCKHRFAQSLAGRVNSAALEANDARNVVVLRRPARRMHEAHGALPNIVRTERAREELVVRAVDRVAALEREHILAFRERRAHLLGRRAREDALRPLEALDLLLTTVVASKYGDVRICKCACKHTCKCNMLCWRSHEREWRAQPSKKMTGSRDARLAAKVVLAALHCHHLHRGVLDRRRAVALLALECLARRPLLVDRERANVLVVVR